MDFTHEKLPKSLKEKTKKSLSAINLSRSTESSDDFNKDKEFKGEERGSEDVFDMYRNGEL